MCLGNVSARGCERRTWERGFSEFCGARGHSNLAPNIFSFSKMPPPYWKTRRPWGRGWGSWKFLVSSRKKVKKRQMLMTTAVRATREFKEPRRQSLAHLSPFHSNAFNASLLRSQSPVVRIVSQKRKGGEIFLSPFFTRLIFVFALS